MSPRDPYRRIAGVYDWLEPVQAGVRRVALDVLTPDPSWRVLDVGCGTGAGMAPYVEAGCEVTGVDVSPSMLERARSRLGDRAELRLIDGDILPFAEDGFDLVMASMVLHEVPPEQRVAFVAEMARVTAGDGRVMLVDFRIGSLRGWQGPVARGVSEIIERFAGHYAQYRSFRVAGGVPAVLDQAGLDIEREKIVAGGNLAVFVVSPA